MRLWYICRCCNLLNTGINKKISAQVDHLIRQGLDAWTVSICAENTPQELNPRIKYVRIEGTEISPRIIDRIQREFRINKIINDIITKSNYHDVIYLRHRYPSLQLVRILSRPRKCKVVFEYQTVELREYLLRKKYWYLPIDFLFGTLMRKHTDAIIGVTNEVTYYQWERSGTPDMPHITIGNGFSVASVPVRTPPLDLKNELHLLCVAIFYFAHGLDRLLHGLALYNGSKKIVLHLVGSSSEVNNLLNLAEDLEISDSVVYHGFLVDKPLDEIFNLCHIAIGTLALHRIGLSEGSILKAREYCARGIPFLYDVCDNDFIPNFPYILHLPTGESPIDIEQVITFAEGVLADPDHPQKMRAYAEEHLDWSVKMKRLKGFLEELVGEKEEDTG